METKTKNSMIDGLNVPERFEKLQDGWIKDNELVLDWGPSSEKRMTLKEAEDYAKSQGGRLPDRIELERLLDLNTHSPATNKIFKDTKTDDYYWTGTRVAGGPGNAWCVGFNFGCVNNYHQDNHFYVRPVRASQ